MEIWKVRLQQCPARNIFRVLLATRAAVLHTAHPFIPTKQTIPFKQNAKHCMTVTHLIKIRKEKTPQGLRTDLTKWSECQCAVIRQGLLSRGQTPALKGARAKCAVRCLQRTAHLALFSLYATQSDLSTHSSRPSSPASCLQIFLQLCLHCLQLFLRQRKCRFKTGLVGESCGQNISLPFPTARIRLQQLPDKTGIQK